MYLADQIVVKLDALFQSHTRNLDFSNMLPMGNTGVYSSWVLPIVITGQYPDNLGLRINMCSLDMVTGVMLGSTISFITGINYG